MPSDWAEFISTSKAASVAGSWGKAPKLNACARRFRADWQSFRTRKRNVPRFEVFRAARNYIQAASSGTLFMNRKARHNHAQIIDLAPTILDYLGVTVPQFMEGKSLSSS